MNNKISIEFEAKLEKAIQAMKIASSMAKVMSNNVRATQTTFKSASNQLSIFSSYNKQLKENLENIAKSLKNYRTALTKLENTEVKGASNKQLQITAINKYKEAISILVREQAKQQAQLVYNQKIEESYKKAGVKNSQELIEQKQKEKQAEKEAKEETKRRLKEKKEAEKEATKLQKQLEKEKQEELEKTKQKYIDITQAIRDTLKGTINGFKNTFKAIGTITTSIGNSIKSIIPNMSKLGKKLYSNFISKAINYSEELNLFNVVFNNIEKNGETVFSKLGLKATQLQNELKETFGTNKMETMRYQGLYQSMGESAGLSKQAAYMMSENMTKLGYDLASLFNTTEQKAMESLRAGVFAGQTKPLRGYGIDVTQQTYKPVLADLGIDKKVSELSQAEKEVLRYIVAIRQANKAQGDFADTIESPANQLKVLKNQMIELGVAIGRYFIAPYQKALQIINGVIMALKELINFMSELFGIQEKQYNSGFSYSDGLDDYSDGLDDVGDSASNTTKKLKELNRQTLAFDQINNINSPQNTGSSGGGGTGGGNYGIDQRLLDAMTGYKNQMDKVKMKAIEIRDTIMEWLGFTKEVDEKTKEVNFTYNGLETTIESIAKQIGTNAGNGLNALTDYINWEDLGTKLAKGINISFGFINSFIQTYDWKNLAGNIANFLNNCISEIDPNTLGQILTDKIRIAILMFSGFTQKFDFKEFAHKLAKTINSAIKNIPIEELVNGINALVNGIFDAINILLKELDWGLIINSIVKLIGGLDWKAKLLIIAPAIANGITSLLTSTLVKSAISKALSKSITELGGSGGLASIFTKAKSAIIKLLPFLGKVSVALGSTMIAGKGIKDTFGISKDISSGKRSALTSIEDTGKAATLTTAGGAAIGTLIAPGIGTAVGALLGALVNLGSALIGAKKGLEDIAYSNIFGDLSISMEEWTEKIQTTITPIEDMGTKLEELQTKQSNLYSEMLGAEENFDNYLKMFSLSAERLNEEEGQEFLNSLSTVATNAKQIIKDSGDHSFATMNEIFKNTSTLTEEEENKILQNILDSNSKKQKSIDDHYLAIEKIVKNAQKKNRKINEQELKDIEEHRKKINELTISEMTETQSEVEYLKKKAIENNGRLDEDSYKRFNEAIDKYYDEQMEIIKGNYNAQAIELKKQHDNNIIDEKEYNDLLKGLQDIRGDQEKKLSDNVANYRKGVYQGIVDEYNYVITQTDDLSKKEKKILENTFTNLNIDTKDLTKQYSSAGTNAGKSFASAFNKNIKTKINSLTVKIPTDLQTDLGLKKSYKLNLAANGGIFSKGSLILAGEMSSEIVGNINGKTEVMNKSQIAETIYRAVKSAMKESDFGGGVDIQLHADEGVIVDRINKITRQTGICPINI